MKRPAVFFDRDNTLIATDGYLGDPAQVKLVTGAADAIARARLLGFAVVVFSNQSGVARGLFAEEDVHAVNARLDELLKSQNVQAVIDRHEFCPDHPEATVEAYRRDSDRRKPGCGMIESAAEALALDLSRSWVIGDAPRDIEAGKRAGCRTILFADPNLPRSPAAEMKSDVTPDHVVRTLRDALDLISADEQSRPRIAGRIEHAAPSADSGAKPSTAKLESVAEQILQQLRHDHESHLTDFSVAKLLAGIAQIVSVAIVFIAYLNRRDASFEPMLIFAVWVQTLTIALLVMGRQR